MTRVGRDSDLAEEQAVWCCVQSASQVAMVDQVEFESVEDSIMPIFKQSSTSANEALIQEML